MDKKTRLKELHAQGVSLWLDSLSREMLNTGDLQRRLEEQSLRGQTSNPSIFQSAVSKGTSYDEDIASAAAAGKSAEEICWQLMIDDVQRACDVFLPMWKESNGGDGYVSLELDPTKAHETEPSIAQGKELWKRVDRPNLMIKVPATEEGLPVAEELLAEGINVNITLLFAVSRYQEVMEAFLKGLERRVAQGQPIDQIASVASFFVSRVESEADKRMDKIGGHDQAIAGLRGKVAVANARAAYQAFQEVFSSQRWKALESKGASLQRPLWASTSTKNDAYPDTLYVDELIGPHCVNTMPESTIEAFGDHGKLGQTLTAEHLADARRVLEQFAAVGVDLDDMTLNTLVVEGVQKFADSYNSLLDTIRKSMSELVTS